PRPADLQKHRHRPSRAAVGRNRTSRRRDLPCRTAGRDRRPCMSANSRIVYLVDDDLSILKALARLLGAEGFETRTYSSPRNFLAGHDDSVPGCIVMDLAMPEMSGLALQDQLISLGHTRPIVFITGQGDIPSSVTAMRAGAINFLTKPFNDED